jgi:hypothetical protein
MQNQPDEYRMNLFMDSLTGVAFEETAQDCAPYVASSCGCGFAVVIMEVYCFYVERRNRNAYGKRNVENGQQPDEGEPKEVATSSGSVSINLNFNP